MATNSCFICDKHRQGPSALGGVIYEDDLVYSGHVHPVPQGAAYLGHLIAEPKRHVVGLGRLTADEAAALGRLVTTLAKALRLSEGAERVSSVVFGDGSIEHLHIHVIPRYPGTPPEYRGLRVSEWPGAPRGGIDEIVATCDRVRASLSDTRSSRT